MEVEYGHNIETDTLGRNESLPRSRVGCLLEVQGRQVAGPEEGRVLSLGLMNSVNTVHGRSSVHGSQQPKQVRVRITQRASLPMFNHDHH